MTQAVVSTGSYIGMPVAAVGNKLFGGGKLWDDMYSIKWNPFNSNEDKVFKSNNISFYKGVPVFLKNSGRSSSFYSISLNKNSNTMYRQ